MSIILTSATGCLLNISCKAVRDSFFDTKEVNHKHCSEKSALSLIMVDINFTSPPSHHNSLFWPPKLSVDLGALPRLRHLRSLPCAAACSLAAQSIIGHSQAQTLTPFQLNLQSS